MSLWNFTPSPGWSQAEALALKHSLAKFGVGRWQEILQSGALPGKTIQQMNCQTQRLLGQQSLAAYTGLRVDIDRIRADNEVRSDAERKNGLVINSGPNPTPAMRRRWQAEAQGKYGLSPLQVEEAKAALEVIAVGIAASRGAGGEPGAGADTGAVETILSVDPESLSDLERGKLVLMLQTYVDSLQGLVQGLGQKGAALKSAAAQTQAPAGSGGKAAQGAEEEPPLEEGKGKRQRLTRDDSTQKVKASRLTEVEASPGSLAEARTGAGAGAVGEEAPATASTAAALGGDMNAFKKGQLQQIVAMGFPKATARKALEKHGYDVEAAVHWIVVNTC